MSRADLTRQAQQFVSGAGDLADSCELRALVEQLKDAKEWWWARCALQRAREEEGLLPESVWVDQQIALCTYKDPNLRRQDSFRLAWTTLLGPDDAQPHQVTSAEQAGLAGAVAKRRWDLEGGDALLREAIRWYDRCAALHLEAASAVGGLDPYGHVNAAFVRDLLAHSQGLPTGVTRGYVTTLRGEAAELRRQVVALTKTAEDRWGPFASRTEALVGLGRLREAQALLEGSKLLSCAAEWERESTATQLLSLAEVQPLVGGPTAVQPLLELLLAPEAPTERAVSSLNRHFGLAMSGGGFRASLFHLGVLARLADEGLLRQLEVMSTVSGGSIAGAAYFASLAQVLSDAGDPEDDGAPSLQRMIDHFVHQVSTKNFRTRAFLDPRLRRRGASRTAGLGRLIETHLLAPLRPVEKGRDLRWLHVVPKGEDKDSFSPKRDNWRRHTKVPVMLVNATSLGTGRPWRFTGSWMGEPGSLSASVSDPVTRLDPVWYDRVDGAWSSLAVGEAVAASAGVPGLFPPTRIRGLYDRRTVMIVDGGVFDNQGVTGLLNQDCTDLFVSDASGLFDERPRPRRWVPSVLLRTNSILMATVRLATAAESDAALTSGQVRDARSVYLLQGVRPDRQQPLGVVDRASDPVDLVTVQSPTHPVDPAVQQALAQLRTDLDRFTEAECFSLMELGYRLASRALEAGRHHLATPRDVPFPWSFRVAAEWMQPGTDKAAELARALRRGRPVFFKWLPGRRRGITRLTR